MHVCLLCTEIFRWGKYGGFGRATRVIGCELARRGIRVSAVIPLPRGRRDPVEETFDGITVHGYPASRTWQSQDIYRRVDADVYHSEEPFLGTYLARRAMPDRAHVITFRNPRFWSDWWIAFLYPNRTRLRTVTTCAYYENPMVRRAVRRADGWAAAAWFLIPKARGKYGLSADPIFLPSPVDVPESVAKADRPTVCFIGRFDRVKRPEVFFALARNHPGIEFIAAGASQNAAFDRSLMGNGGLPANLRLTGFIDQFSSSALSDVLSRSWILVNTSAKEALPNTFIEAAAYRCAILGAFDPDGFTTRFGRLVSDGDYSAGLAYLLDGDRWRGLGEAGHAYAREHFATDVVIGRHIKLYEDVLAIASGRRR